MARSRALGVFLSIVAIACSDSTTSNIVAERVSEKPLKEMVLKLNDYPAGYIADPEAEATDPGGEPKSRFVEPMFPNEYAGCEEIGIPEHQFKEPVAEGDDVRESADSPILKGVSTQAARVRTSVSTSDLLAELESDEGRACLESVYPGEDITFERSTVRGWDALRVEVVGDSGSVYAAFVGGTTILGVFAFMDGKIYRQFVDVAIERLLDKAEARETKAKP